MTWRECVFLIWSDLDRYHRHPSFGNFLRELFVGQGFRYMFWQRLNRYLMGKGLLWGPVKVVARLILHHYSYKFATSVSLYAEVGPGFKIEHTGMVRVNGAARIGARCTVCHEVTLGSYHGAPTLGDFVFIGPGAKLMGGIHVGNNAIIGANSTVTKDVPDDAVVVGTQGSVISLRGNLRGERLEEAKQLLEEYQTRAPSTSGWPGKAGE